MSMLMSIFCSGGKIIVILESDFFLPHWSSAVRKVVLVQPSSATAERVFSMLNQSFGEQQQNALEDLVETTIMLQYNKRKN